MLLHLKAYLNSAAGFSLEILNLCLDYMKVTVEKIYIPPCFIYCNSCPVTELSIALKLRSKRKLFAYLLIVQVLVSHSSVWLPRGTVPLCTHLLSRCPRATRIFLGLLSTRQAHPWVRCFRFVLLATCYWGV